MKTTCLALLAAAAASACPDGQFDVTTGAGSDCFSCPAGKYALAADASCKICAAGEYSEAGSTACTAEPRHSFHAGHADQIAADGVGAWGVPMDNSTKTPGAPPAGTLQASVNPTPAPFTHQTKQTIGGNDTVYDTHHVHTASQDIGEQDTTDGNRNQNEGDGHIGNFTSKYPTAQPTANPTKAPTTYPTPAVTAVCMNGPDAVVDGWSGEGALGNYCNHGECFDGHMVWNGGAVLKNCTVMPAGSETLCTHVTCEFKYGAVASDGKRIFITHTNSDDKTPTMTNWHNGASNTAHACGYNKHTDKCTCFCSV